MRVHLEYGRTGLAAELPDRHVVKCLGYRPGEPLFDPVAAVGERLRRPVGAPPLAEVARGRRDACVVICDITRPVPNSVILPPILETLERGGIPREKILLLVATGMHRPNLGGELVEMVGPWVAENYCIENHDGRELSAHTYLGETARGVPAWVDSRYVAADLKILTGLIEPHLMAGYSGGRKLVCPGLAALETIKVWHGPEFIEHPNAREGCLEDNPVHEENTRIARMAGCDFIVNTVIDAQRRILEVVAGDMEAAFCQGVQFVRRLVVDTVPEPVDIVITTAAGYPLDTTYYQSIKGLTAALPIVKPGGTIILAASLSEGIGSGDFQRLFAENPTLESFTERIFGKQYFVMDQWQLQELAKVRRKAQVIYVSDGLSPEALGRLFVDSAATIDEALSTALSRHGKDATIAVIPKGPYVLAQVA